MGFIVKNTTKNNICDVVCPHRCRGCGELGEVLCECCKKDITFEKMNHCPKCGKVIVDKCNTCKVLPFSATYVVGYRDELIGELTKEFKFHGVRRLGDVLAEILDDFLPDFNGDVAIVPLPTIRKHIRERGVDHTFIIAKKLAKMRGWEVSQVIGRRRNTVQVGANELMRRRQAKEAYEIVGGINSDRIYVLLDDFWTTGASMTEAGKLLKKAGAKKIVAAVIATNRKVKGKLSRNGSTSKRV